MLRMLIGVREGMVELRIGNTSRVMRCGEREKSGLATGELEQRGAHEQIVADQA